VAGDSLTPEILAQLHAQCERFESAWQAGKAPSPDDFLDEFVGDAREQLVRELTKIEKRHRGDTVGRSAKTHADFSLEPEMATLFERPAAPRTAGRAVTADTSVPTLGEDTEITMAEMNWPGRQSGSTSGLLIRCPHCANGVELLADTPFDDISCNDCGSTFKLVDREKLVTASVTPKSIGRFKLEERLGAGGFGTVWKARDTDLDRVVAVKIPRKGQLGPEDIEQFYREARAAAQLRHPHIVPVYEVGRDGDRVFIVSDLIHGMSLSQWVIGRRLNSHDVARLCIQLAEALEHAHRQGIIHRDLKPSNVMIDEAGEPHLMDFGLAKREMGEVTMTVDGQILGTPSYMSPEQASGQGHWVDRRTDIYSLGVIMFKLLTDELPFRGSIQNQLQQRLLEDAPDPRGLNRHIPRDTATICLKCLERDPNKRYNSSQALADELRRFLRGEPILARPISRTARLARWAQRKPAQAIAVALTVLLAIFGPLAAWLIEGQRQRLEELVAEKNNVIAQSVTDAERATAKITLLGEQLDLWEGHTNPWEFWPPESASRPRQLVLKRLFDQHYQTFAASLEAGQLDDRQVACGQLGLALLAEHGQQTDEAEQHAQAARAALERLVKVEPNNSRYQTALAQCYSQLGRLYADTRKTDSAAALKQAGLIYEQLAAEHPGEPRFRVDLLETELRSAVQGGFTAAQSQLLQAGQIEQKLQQNWPTDPVALYELVSFLTGQEAVLIRNEKSDGVHE
jgi:tetratricopeptide (TPR) repeat protein